MNRQQKLVAEGSASMAIELIDLLKNSVLGSPNSEPVKMDKKKKAVINFY